MSLANLYLKNVSQIFVYYTEKGFLSKLHPLSKIVLIFTTIALTILCSKIELLLLTLVILVILASTSIDLKRITSLFLSLTMFVLPMIFFSLIYTSTNYRSLYKVMETSISIAVAMVRLLTMSIAFYIFFITTKPQSIARVLNKIGIPYKYSYGFIIALRFLSVISSDLLEIISIQKTRGLSIDRNFLDRVRGYIAVLVPLIISTLNRVDEITVSLEVKGFGLKNSRSYLNVEHFEFFDVLFIFFCITLASTALYFGI